MGAIGPRDPRSKKYCKKMSMLTLKYREKKIGDYPLKEKTTLTIGRGKNNDVVIADPSVSGRHAKIDSVGDRFVLIDLRSKNGTFVNESLADTHWLKHGDVISVGNHHLVYCHYAGRQALDDDPEEMEHLDTTIIMDTSLHRNMMIKSNPTRSINVVRFWDKRPNRNADEAQTPPTRPIAINLENQVKGFITYLSGGFGSVKLIRKISTIGRHPSSDVVVKGFFVGQTAVTITLKPEGFYLTPISGLAKPKLNGRKVKEPTIIEDLATIEIGSAKLQFSIADPKLRQKKDGPSDDKTPEADKDP